MTVRRLWSSPLRDPTRCGEARGECWVSQALDPAYISNAASNALAMASLLLPARMASPTAMTVCLPLPNGRKRPAVSRRAR